jgi:hypothetical protein
MGRKRKASDSLSPCPVSSSPSITSPAHHNFHTPQPFPSQIHSNLNRTSRSGWSSLEPCSASGILHSSAYSSIDVNTPAHLNSRTRKRLRDNRPDEETIYQTTLSKLYAAQKHDAQPENQDHPTPPAPSPTPSQASLTNLDSTTSITNSTTQQKEKGQASLHAFFGTGQPTSKHQNSTFRPPGQDPQSSTAPALIPTASCEDCSAPLLSQPIGDVMADTEMMDIDFDARTSPEEDDPFHCAICSKRACDTCAVRGDRRICLECANLGNGYAGQGYSYYNGVGMGGSCGMEAGVLYRPGVGMDLVEKRWVGGIGWV